MSDELAFQIVRPDDLVVLGVVLSGFAHVGAPGAVAVVQAVDDASSARLTFPPQHLLEQYAEEIPIDVWSSLGGRLAPGTPVTAVQPQGTDWVDLFAIDDYGELAWLPGHGRGSWARLYAGAFPRGSRVAAVSRGPEMIDVYAVDVNGALITGMVRSFRPEPMSGFGMDHRWRAIDTGYQTPAAVTAVSRGPKDVDIFAVKDGQAWHTWQWPGGTYQSESKGGSFPPGATIAVVALDSERVDIFATHRDGDSVEWCFWVVGQPWTRFASLGAPDGLPGGASVGAVARPSTGIDLFVVGEDEQVHTNNWRFDRESWLGGWMSLSGDFPPGAPITAVSRSPDSVDLTGADWRGRTQGASAIGDSWSTERCSEWTSLGEWYPPGSPVTAHASAAGVSLFAVGADRGVHRLAWAGVTDCGQPEGTFYFDTPLRQARTGSRVSRVKFRVRAGTRIALTGSGVLGALNNAAIMPAAEAGLTATLIEIPWGLLVAPLARSQTDEVTCAHPADAVRPWPSQAAGLWRTALRARAVSPDAHDAGLLLDVVNSTPDDDGLDRIAFDAPKRQVIADGSQRGLRPLAQRLELSALGGSLVAGRSGDGMDWHQTIVLGRDQRIRTVRKGVLYPLGHRAEYVEVTERIIDARSTTSIAPLRSKRTLIVTERVRGPAADPALRRTFPFAAVEITTDVFSDLDDGGWTTIPRPTAALDAVKAQLVDLRKQADALRPIVDAALQHTATFDELLARGDAAAFALREIWGRMSDVEARLAVIAETQARLDALSRALTQIGNPGPDDTEAHAQIAVIVEEMASLGSADDSRELAELAQLGNEAAPHQAALDEAARPPADIYALMEAGLPGSPAAESLIAVEIAISAKEQERDAELATIARRLEVFCRPQTASGEQLQFPVRFAGAAGDLRLTLPLIFVVDEPEPPVGGLPPFVPLANATVMGLVEEAWAASRRVPLPGVAIDLVHDAPVTDPADRQPGDVHEVHELTLACRPGDGGLRPHLDEFRVGLPAARGLLDDESVHAPQTLQYAQAFVDGAARDVALAFAEPDGLKLDFAAQADRAGALVAPVFSANRISRTLGLVNDAAALAGAAAEPLSPANVFDAGATVLGFDLRDVVAGFTRPPQMTSLLGNGAAPVVRLRWGWPDPGDPSARPIPLRDHGPLKANLDGVPGTIELSVERSPTSTSTTCMLGSFELHLPSPSDGLIALKFRSLTFTQTAGSKPRLAIDGLDLAFLNELELLDDLRKEAAGLLGTAGPSIEAAASSVSIGYGIEIPEASAGAFSLRNIAFHTKVLVPFDKAPISVELSFASRANPFNLSVLTFGGGGYIVLKMTHEGLMAIDAALEFGAAVSVNFFIAKGEVHALGGARYSQERPPNGPVTLEGFLRMGGSVSVLGLVSVSIELVIKLKYRQPDDERADPQLVGRATLVVEIDLTLYSDSVEIDSGDWVLVGGDDTDAEREPASLEDWRAYQAAFAA